LRPVQSHLRGLGGVVENPKKSKYDPILDQFLDGEHRLGEVTVEGKKAGYVRHLLDKRIKAMGLEGRVEAYVSSKTLYLEKV